MTAMDYYMLGFSLAAVGDSAGASGAYQAAAGGFKDEKRREALEARAFVARAHLKNGAAPHARPHLQFIAEADERGGVVKDIYFLLADAYVGVEDSAQAIAALEKALAVGQRTPAVFARLAELLEMSGQAERAKMVYEAMKKAAGEK
jgi:Tfp pilus assembly protein PilF